MQKKSYYAVIPADVRYCESLPQGAKLLYGELTALSNEKGYCWASNQYFSELYGNNDRTIQRWIRALEMEGFIRCAVQGMQRKIWIVEGDKNVMLRGTKMSPLARQKCHHNNKENSTEKMTTHSASSLSKATRSRMDDIVPTDDEGYEAPQRKKRLPTEGKNTVALRIRAKFGELCKKYVGITPVADVKGYKMVLYAINTGKLSEPQVMDLFDEWFKMGKSDEETVQLTRALSTNQINGYKVRNNIKD